MTTAIDPRRLLLGLLETSLDRVNGRAVVARFLAQRAWQAPLRMVAVGKAAAAMALGAFDVLDDAIADALIITKHGHCDPRLPARVHVIEAGHPTPDAASLEAGRALLEFIDLAPERAPFLFLISGGASALVEVLPAGVALQDLARVNDWLLGAGMDIAAMNRVRKRVSCIKQGRLALRLQGRAVLNLLISDVPGDDPAVIGSGLLIADPDAGAPLPPLPSWVASLCELAPAPPAPGTIAGVETHILATNFMALDAAAREGGRHGLAVCECGRVAGDARGAGARIAARLEEGTPGLYLWGGEASVVLPPAPGRGGRCQTLALEAALGLADHEDCFVLAVGSDGTDGPGEDAGALVDGGTVARGAAEGLDALGCLVRADAGTFLEASGDLISTGPTGTNVMDLVFALKIAPDPMSP